MTASAPSLIASLKPLLEPARRNTEFYQRRRLVIGVIAIIAFPLYWVVWRYLYPQPYENLTLRLFGVALFFPLMVSDRWPLAWRPFLPYAWLFAFFYSLPFFFTFMMLKNGGSAVWTQSFLVAIFAMVLALDAFMLLVLFVMGSGLAWVMYVLTTDAPMTLAIFGPQLWVMVFALVFGAAANFANERIRAEQERAMLATAGSVAHELRTPLLSIKAGAGGLRNHLPLLIDAYTLARSRGLPVAAIRDVHLEGLRGVLDRVEREADYSNAIIDMLVTNTRGMDKASPSFGTCSMLACIEVALARYPFSDQERNWVNVEGRDFEFHGETLLMVHVLFNLTKNALRHIAMAGRGIIVLHLESDQNGHRLLFRDTGSGIAPAILPHVFERFYSGADGDSILGSGIGLAFCRDVMHAFGGHIVCRSEEGAWTEFELGFPVVSA